MISVTAKVKPGPYFVNHSGKFDLRTNSLQVESNDGLSPGNAIFYRALHANGLSPAFEQKVITMHKQPATLHMILQSVRVDAVQTVQAANDNAAHSNDADNQDEMLAATLRLFAVHGLSAGEHAHGQALDAFWAGESASYRWWSEICRMLDQRLARSLPSDQDDDINRNQA